MKVRRRTICLCGLLAVLLLGGFFIWLWRGGSIRERGESGPAYGPIRDSTPPVAGKGAPPMPDRPPVVGGSNISDEMLHEMLDEIVARMSEEFHGKDKAKIKANLIRQFNEVLPYDKEKSARFDLPEEELSTTPTDRLAWHFFLKTPMAVNFGLYDDPNIGILRCIRSSRTLSALISREDMIEGMVKMYSEVPIEPEKIRDYGIRSAGKISSALYDADQLLMYPPIFPRTKGHEKELLSHLCQRYRRLTRVNQRYESMGKHPPYGVVFNTTKLLALRFLKRLDPQAYEEYGSLKIKDEPLLFTTIEQICRARNNEG